jgi:type I restriction enzyme S subunit
MVVEKGYKLTEVGVIPEDWEVIKIGEFIEFKNGLNKEKKFFGYGTPIINYMDVFNSRGINPRDIYGKVFLNKSEIGTYNAKKGDVFFTRTSETVDEIGITSVLLEDLNDTVFSGFILRGREKSHKLNIEFKKYCFSEQSVRNQIISTASYTTRALTNGRLLSQVLVKIPPLHEQTAIANALSDMDALIAKTEKLIEKKKAIKQGVMQEMLKPKEGWVTKKLGEVGEIITGGTPSTIISQYWNGNIPWITPTDIKEVRDIDSSERQITEKGLQQLRRLPENSLLITCIASIGKNAILRKSGACNQQINAIVPNQNNNIEFLYYLLELNKSLLIGSAGITATLILSKKEFSELSLSFPGIKQQTQIAETIALLDNEILVIKTKLQKLKNQKQGMMQALLTGKIRLV